MLLHLVRLLRSLTRLCLALTRLLLTLIRWTLQGIGLGAVLLVLAHPRTTRRLLEPRLRPHLRSARILLDRVAYELNPPPPLEEAPPIHWPVDQRRITSGFGTRVNPVTGHRHHHRGVDVPVPIGTPVRAARGSVVQRAREDGLNGKYVVLVDDRGGLRLAYCHLSELLVVEGERVEAGQLIGRSGNTGRSTGPHLHFGTWYRGVAVDPRRLARR